MSKDKNNYILEESEELKLSLNPLSKNTNADSEP
jgi:hypothetical protein